jgi:hypothetical protein
MDGPGIEVVAVFVALEGGRAAAHRAYGGCNMANYFSCLERVMEELLGCVESTFEKR